MASSNHHHLLLLPLLVIFSSIHPTKTTVVPDPQTQQLIKTICRQNKHFGSCHNKFTDSLETPSTNILGLSKIALDLGLSYAIEQTQYFIPELVKTTTNELAKEDVTSCLRIYSSMSYVFADSIEAFQAKNYERMLDKVSIAPKLVRRCHKHAVKVMPATPLIGINKEMRIINNMALVTAVMLALSQG